MTFLGNLLVIIGIYVILAESQELLAGQTGLLSIAQAALFGVGAYTSALLTVDVGAPIWAGFACAMGLASLTAVVATIPIARLGGQYFCIATFCLQIVATDLITNWQGLTRGPLGLPGIPRPEVLGEPVGMVGFIVLAAGAALLSVALVRRLAVSSFGRALRVIREDEALARSWGMSPRSLKWRAAAFSGALAGMAGAIFAHHFTFIDPTSFTLSESILIAVMVILGGSGNPLGAVIGASFLVTLPEVLRFVGIPASQAGNVRELVYGLLLVMTVWLRPHGLLGRWSYTR